MSLVLAILSDAAILLHIEILEIKMKHSQTQNKNISVTKWFGLSINSPMNRCADLLTCADLSNRIQEQRFNYNGMN